MTFARNRGTEAQWLEKPALGNAVPSQWRRDLRSGSSDRANGRRDLFVSGSSDRSLVHLGTFARDSPHEPSLSGPDVSVSSHQSSVRANEAECHWCRRSVSTRRAKVVRSRCSVSSHRSTVSRMLRSVVEPSLPVVDRRASALGPTTKGTHPPSSSHRPLRGSGSGDRAPRAAACAHATHRGSFACA